MKLLRFSVFLFVAVLLTGCGLASAPKAPTPGASPPVSVRFELRGAEVYDGGKLLFTNVSNVKAVRLGPDGRTIHFQHISPPDRFTDFQPSCADLESKVVPAEPNYPDRPPAAPPWDYARIANYATIEGCGDYGRSGGFLEHSDYFAYVEISSDGSAQLKVEDAKSEVASEFSLPSNIFRTEKPEDHISWEATAINGRNGSEFFYPQMDARLKSGKLVLAFGTQLFAIDPVYGELLGTERLATPPYNVVAASFWFHSREDSPFLIVESGWEGGRGFQAILDLSGDTLRVHRINELPQPNLSGFKTSMIEWGDGNLTLNLFKQVEVNGSMIKADLATLENVYQPDPENAVKREQEIAAKLMKAGQYIEVMCYHAGMGGGGCSALIPGDTYRIEAGGELEKSVWPQGPAVFFGGDDGI